jgi:hypothetical protein
MWCFWKVSLSPTSAWTVFLFDIHAILSPTPPDWLEIMICHADAIDVTFKPPTPTDPAQITISSSPPPKITILYRTLPRYSGGNAYAYTTKNDPGAKVVMEDRVLRPDLRLGRSDLGVRKVGEIVKWFSGFIGGDFPL